MCAVEYMAQLWVSVEMVALDLLCSGQQIQVLLSKVSVDSTEGRALRLQLFTLFS